MTTFYPCFMSCFVPSAIPSAWPASGSIVLSPRGISFMTYRLVLHNQMIAYGYRNTLFNVFFGTTLNFFLTAMAAYALSRPSLPGQKVSSCGYRLYHAIQRRHHPTVLAGHPMLGLRNNLLAVILPTAINTWNLLIMRTFFAALPAELEESARLDGAGEFTILFRIFLPVSKPVVATILLYYWSPIGMIISMR